MIMKVISTDVPSYQHMRPILHKKCKQADRVRSLGYNYRTQEIAVVSLNGYIHCWNALKMKQVLVVTNLKYAMSNVLR